MKRNRFRGLALGALLQVRHLRTVDLVALILIGMSATIWMWALPEMAARLATRETLLATQRAALVRLPKSQAALPASKNQTNLAALRATLGDQRGVEKPLAILFSLARANQLTLAKGEYKLEFNPRTHIYAYQILIPVVGTYRSIRGFCDQMLLQVPFASLDEVRFRRDSVGAGVLEGKLRFSLHLTDRPVTPDMQQTLAAGPSMPAPFAGPDAGLAQAGSLAPALPMR